MADLTRRTLLTAAATLAPASAVAAAPAFAPVVPGRRLVFPRDHGAHPEFRTEWWYITGWLEENGAPLGFQVTFFRTRTGLGEDNPSRFAPRQVLFAHAALSDPRTGRLLHGQRIAREGFGLAEASTRDMDVVLDDWRLVRTPAGVLKTQATGDGFSLDLTLTPTQPLLLQGQEGFSRKGPRPGQASYYYSLPHLKVSGVLGHQGRRRQVRGQAWLDREWSSTLLDPSAVGWDWTGVNLDDGGGSDLERARRRRGLRSRPNLEVASHGRGLSGGADRAHEDAPGGETLDPDAPVRRPGTGQPPLGGTCLLGRRRPRPRRFRLPGTDRLRRAAKAVGPGHLPSADPPS